MRYFMLYFHTAGFVVPAANVKPVCMVCREVEINGRLQVCKKKLASNREGYRVQ